ncbi:MAG: hypothetical protein J5981_06370 [Lachnospira sp.]|nr:hypothetical protein [Lachnospira sp.]
MRNDIITDHKERMFNLKKYYPFFKLIDVSFAQFKEGRYEMLDMGYIVMAVLRFFIEENNFKEKEVIYPEYLEFISELLRHDFDLELSGEEYKEIADYIFDKLKNDGRPFEFTYYDPVEKKKRVSRMKIIESSIRESTVWYSISSDAIEFYLDTKEIKDESRISVQQLLLEKMIQAQNFKGGTEVIARINDEVSRLQLKKNEVMDTLSKDIFAGIDAYEEFVSTGMCWFAEEEKLFKKNKELIEAAYLKMEAVESTSESYYRTMNEIYELDNQLKVAMGRHGELLKACTDMQKMTDEAIVRAKLGRLRSHTDFGTLLNDMVNKGNADLLVTLLTPLFMPNKRKHFALPAIDEALTVKPVKQEKAEKSGSRKQEEIVFEDELEEQRIKENYTFIMRNLLAAFKKKKRFTLSEFGEAMSRMYSPEILKNADYYSFFVNLCQKQRYTIGGTENKESFLDEILTDTFAEADKITFCVQPAVQEENAARDGQSDGDSSQEQSELMFYIAE